MKTKGGKASSNFSVSAKRLAIFFGGNKINFLSGNSENFQQLQNQKTKEEVEGERNLVNSWNVSLIN